MYAEVGNWLVVRGSEPVFSLAREGQIVEVPHADGEDPPYVVHWLDQNRLSTVFPGPDTTVSRSRPAPLERVAPGAAGHPGDVPGGGRLPSGRCGPKVRPARVRQPARGRFRVEARIDADQGDPMTDQTLRNPPGRPSLPETEDAAGEPIAATDAVQPLSRLGLPDVDRARGKGANLGEMLGAGVPVPTASSSCPAPSVPPWRRRVSRTSSCGSN